MADSRWPKISVVIPNYNHAQCLRAALASACNQEPPPHEVFVFDDCSTDNSLEMIEAYARRFPFVHYLRYPSKSVDWQRAWFDHVHLATGDWVLALSADDLIYPGFMEAVGRMAAQYPQCGIVVTNVDIISSKRGVVGMRNAGIGKACFLEGEPLRIQLRKLLVAECGSATIIRKDALLWLGKNNITDLGPWSDAIGYPVVGLKHGVCYVPRLLGAVCFDDEKPTWSQALLEDSDQAKAVFEHVTRFLRSAEVAKFVPADVVYALENKVIQACPSETRNALLLPRLLKQSQEILRSGRLDQAEQWLLHVLREFPDQAELQTAWGVVQYGLGRLADAEAAFRHATEQNPNLAAAFCNWGVCLQARGALAEALAMCRRAVEIDPRSALGFARLGNTLLALGRWQEALDASQKALALDPDVAHARAILDEAVRQLGRLQ